MYDTKDRAAAGTGGSSGQKAQGTERRPQQEATCATTVLGLGVAAQVGARAAEERKLHLPTYPCNWPPFLISQRELAVTMGYQGSEASATCGRSQALVLLQEIQFTCCHSSQELLFPGEKGISRTAVWVLLAKKGLPW